MQGAWPRRLIVNGWSSVNSFAFRGKTMNEAYAPNWTRCNNQQDETKVVIFLGTNDIARGLESYGAAHRLIGEYKRLGCDVSVVLPPVFPQWPDSSVERRAEITAAARAYGIEPLDVQFELEETYDGIHPTDGLQDKLAIRIYCHVWGC
jgi:hypothetical protein